MAAAAIAAGHSAGHSACRKISANDTSTRRHAVGNSPKTATRVTGIAVPSATPTSPKRPRERNAEREVGESHQADERGEPAVQASSFENDRGSRAADPDDHRPGEELDDDGGGGERRTDPRHQERVGEQHQTAGNRKNRRQRQPRALDEQLAEPCGSLAGITVDYDRKQRFAQLIRQTKRDFGQTLRRRPQGNGGGAEQGANHHDIGRIVHPVGGVEREHEDAEPGDLAQPFAPEQPPVECEAGKDTRRVQPVNEERRDADGGRGRDQRHQPVASREDEHVRASHRQARADARQVVEVIALESDDHAAVDSEDEAKRDVGPDDEQQRAGGRLLIGREAGEVVHVGGDHENDRVSDGADGRVDDRAAC